MNIFCALSRIYYRVKESPLDEHRDVDMHLIVRDSFSHSESV